MEIVAQQPDREREREGEIGYDQRHEIVEKAIGFHHEVERYDERNAGQHARAEIEQQQGGAAAEVEPGQAVPGEGPEHEVEERGAERCDERVEHAWEHLGRGARADDRSGAGRIKEDAVILERGVLRDPLRRHRQRVALMHEAREHKPGEGREQI